MTTGSAAANTVLSVGRRQVEDRILALLEHAPALVVVEGELGIGKTHLVHRIRTSAMSLRRRMVTGRCTPGCGPLQPMLEAVLDSPELIPLRGDPVLGALVPSLPELADRLPPSLPPLSDPRADLARRLRALRVLFSASGPVVLLLDDVHHADPGTRAFLQYVARRPPGNLAMMLTYRPHENAPGLAHLATPGFPVEHTLLEPLDDADTTALAARLRRRGPLPAGMCARLTLTEGIPLAITALARDTRAGTPGEGPDLPAALRDAYLEPLRQQSRDLRCVVRAAAVCDDGASEAELRALSGLNEAAVSAALTSALTAGILRELRPNRFGCHRELARQAVHGTTPVSARRRLHRTAATLWPDDPVRVAHHLFHAGDHDRWRAHSEHSAEAAVKAGDWSTAVQLLRDVLRRAELTPEDRVELAMTLSRAAFDGLDTEQIVTTVRELITEVPLPDAVRGELRNNLGVLLLSQAGDHDTGYRELERAAVELEHSNPTLALKVMSSLAIPYTGRRHISTHRAWLDRVEAGLLDPARRPDPLTAETIHVNKLTTLMSTGSPQAWDASEFLIEDTDDPGLARQRLRGCLNLTDCASWLGRYTAAREYLTRGHLWSRQLGAAYLTEQLHVASVLLDWLRGSRTHVRDNAETLIARYATLPSVASECRLVAGALAFEHGDTATAFSHLTDISAAHPGTPAAPPISATAAALLAHHHYRRGAKTTAMRHLDAALGVITDTGMWVWAGDILPVAAELLPCAGRTEELRQLLDTATADLEDIDAPAANAGLALAQAMTDDLTQRPATIVLGAYDQALARFTELPRPHWLAATHVLRDRYTHNVLHQDTDDLATAAGIYGTLGATPAYRRCQDLLTSRTPRKRGRPGYGSDLSPREAEVAALAGDGRTNAQIAHCLGLSIRTVEQHVARALRKTGATSRRDLLHSPWMTTSHP
ncbi:ATP-binding protein [Amycolatopsis thailandensis]|uniref:ATP-binding protein n=1 Tax=Amycolatopsis thailandensis TaxID=589330 RepID=UPI0037AED635